MNRPSYALDEHLTFLDDLRESGVTNMFGAAPHLVEATDLTLKESTEVLKYWMATFSERYPD
jgi:hypothetical protein